MSGIDPNKGLEVSWVQAPGLNYAQDKIVCKPSY